MAGQVKAEPSSHEIVYPPYKPHPVLAFPMRLPKFVGSQHARVRSPRGMKTLAGCPESATPIPALPPAWGRGGWGGYSWAEGMWGRRGR